MDDMVFPVIKYPEMRDELVEHLKALSDRQYQEAVWVRGESRAGIEHDELDVAIHFIYDDTCLGEDPSLAIGCYLKDEIEAQSIRELVHNLDNLFSKYGLDLSDGEYINKPEWTCVLQAAQASRNLFLA
jgi:hypothetical protein